MTAIIADLQDSATWSGQTIPCTLSYVSKIGDDVAMDGVLYPAELVMAARVAAFTSSVLPANRDAIAITSTRLGLSAVKYFVNSQNSDGIAATFYLRRN